MYTPIKVKPKQKEEKKTSTNTILVNHTFEKNCQRIYQTW